MKKYIYILIFALILTSCALTKPNSDDTIHISNREIFSSDNPASLVHMPPVFSEFMDIKYTGENTYKLDIEIWEKGVLVDTDTRVSDIELVKYNGFSLEVDDRNPLLYKVTFGMYGDDGSTSMNFDIEVEPSELKGKVESTYHKDVEFTEAEDVVLWGFHRFDNSFEGFEDTYDAAKNLDWSLVFVLRSE